MQRITRILIIYGAFVLLSACTKDKHADEVISHALTMIEERPDFALAVLDEFKDEKSAWPRSQRMRYELVFAQAQNKAFVPFTTDSTILEVVKFYNRRGSANERMMANYMAGCVYRDLGDAPTALNFFCQAAEAADTTNKDCDLATLMRIHSQLGWLFQKVAAFDDQDREYALAEDMAWRIHDTISALHLMWARSNSLYIQEDYAGAIAILDSLAVLERKYNVSECAECVYPVRLDERLKHHDSKAMGKLLREYETKMGYQDIHNCTMMRLDYHYYKGEYFLLAGKVDSALMHFMYLKDNATEYELYELAYSGLKEAYKQKHMADSAIKYADLYCLANDSTTKHRASDNVIRMQALYNYNKSQADAFRSERRATNLRILFVVTIVMIFLAGFFLWRIYYRRLKLERQLLVLKNVEYSQLIQRYDKSEEELHFYKANAKRFLEEKEKENNRLRKVLSNMLDVDGWNEERNILNCEIAEHLHSLSARGKKATLQEFESLKVIAQSCFPEFYSIVTTEDFALSEKEKIVCVLIRFHFISTEMAILMGLSPQRITNIKSAINSKLFDVHGAKTLEKKLMELK